MIHNSEDSGIVIGAAIEVHRRLGPGLLESAYERCLIRELRFRGIPFENQVGFPIEYRGETVDCGYRVDFVVRGEVVVEIKSVRLVEPIHEAQLLTYMKLGNFEVGLLINFNVPSLRQGITRLVR